MFCRIIQIQFSSDQRASILAFIESAADEIQSLDGIESGVVVETGTGEAVVVMSYTSEDAYNAISESTNRLLGGLVELLRGPPTIAAGPAIWSFTG